MPTSSTWKSKTLRGVPADLPAENHNDQMVSKTQCWSFICHLNQEEILIYEICAEDKKERLVRAIQEDWKKNKQKYLMCFHIKDSFLSLSTYVKGYVKIK